ncbi:MAG TPA: GNAT family N-acetyltransferase [Gaiellaceae bacterium]|nr:GNAT family N-acetyltransferase [Gaiellaceae bacterium]
MSETIRPADRDDVPGILAILNEAIETTTASWHHRPLTLAQQLAWFDAKQAEGWPVLVAEAADGGIAGWATFGPFRPWEGYRFTVEHSVYVDGAHRRRGIATRLLTALIEEARRRGLHAMLGGTSGENTESMVLHERLGFEQVARFPEIGEKFGRRLDLVFFELLLEDER